VEAAHVVVLSRESEVEVLRGLAGDHEQPAAFRPDGEGGAVVGSAAEREVGRRADRRVERGRCFEVGDADREPIDVVLGSRALTIDGAETIAGLIFEKGRCWRRRGRGREE
jgi:hypothetical protein